MDLLVVGRRICGGQRRKEAWRIGAPELAWEIFDGLYRRLMPVVESFGAKPLALTSNRFVDPKGFDPAAKPVLYAHRIVKGR